MKTHMRSMLAALLVGLLLSAAIGSTALAAKPGKSSIASDRNLQLCVQQHANGGNGGLAQCLPNSGHNPGHSHSVDHDHGKDHKAYAQPNFSNLTLAQLVDLKQKALDGTLSPSDPRLAELGVTYGEVQAVLRHLGNKSNHDNDEDNDSGNDNDDDDNTTSTAPIVIYETYPTYPTVQSYGYLPGNGNAYVDGFGPVLVESVVLTTGQTLVIPALPYNLNMPWGTFGTYANWVAQFEAANGRAPVDTDLVQFWVSQAVAGVLNIHY